MPAKMSRWNGQRRVPVERARPGQRARRSPSAGRSTRPSPSARPRTGARRARARFISARQPKQAVRLERLHAPEVERLARPRSAVGVAPAPPQAGAAGEEVEQAAQPPEHVAVVPPGLAADPLDRREGRGRRARHRRGARVDEPRPEPRRRRTAGARRGAASDQRVSANSRSSFASARAIASRTPRGRTANTLERAPVAHDGLVAQRCRSASGRPARRPGVTSPSQRLESRGVRTGTGIISRRSPRWRAYSRIRSP